MPKLYFMLSSFFKFMKKLLTFLILTYLLITINSIGITQEQNKLKNENLLKIGVLLPLSGEFKDIG